MNLTTEKILSDILHDMSIEELENLTYKVLPLIINERKFLEKNKERMK